MSKRASSVRVLLQVAVLLVVGSLVAATRAQTPPAGGQASEAAPQTDEACTYGSASLGQCRFAPPPAGRENLTQLHGIQGVKFSSNQTATPQSYPPEQVEAGQKIFAAQCGFCHGRDAMGGESGPDLTRAAIVAEDLRGDKLGPLVRNGRVDKGMPAFNLSDFDLIATVAFIHDQKRKAELPGRRRSVEVDDLQTGNVEAGKRYFDNACTKCHSSTGDLAGIAKRLQGLALLHRMLYPGSGRDAAAPSPPKVTVTLPSGQKVSGTLAYRDEFTIALTEPDGWYRSWPVRQVTFTVDDPLQAHVEQLGRYTDRDMHDVLAYLQTLR